MRELALFAGAGGGILGGRLLGWRTVCAVEFEPYAASVLAQRQNDRLLSPFPIWDDVRTFDGRPWRGLVDVVAGGFPCQDISKAGFGAGLDGDRSGLWVEMARIIGEVRPRYAFVENSPMLTSRGLGVVLGDLAALGYDARWGVLGAADVGAPHLRERIWIGARYRTVYEWAMCECGEWWCNIHGMHASDCKCPWDSDAGEKLATPLAFADCVGSQGSENARGVQGVGDQGKESAGSRLLEWNLWQSEPDVGRVANGVAARVDRLKAIGNGQVPQCAAEAWRLLSI